MCTTAPPLRVSEKHEFQREQAHLRLPRLLFNLASLLSPNTLSLSQVNSHIYGLQLHPRSDQWLPSHLLPPSEPVAEDILIPQAYPSAELTNPAKPEDYLKGGKERGPSINTEARSNNRLDSPYLKTYLILKHMGFSGSLLPCCSSCWAGVPDVLAEAPESQLARKNVRTDQEFRQRSQILVC